MISKLLAQRVVRYLIMASILVGLELIVFVLMTGPLHITYLVATPASTLVSIILNWHYSRSFVFRTRVHSAEKEFTLVFIGSLIGITLQLIVTSFCVEILHLVPIEGKLLAIFVTFFWNYWFRKRYVFNAPIIIA